MREWTEKLSALLGRILVLGSGVQIVLGLIWMLANFGSFQEFPESYFLLEVSEKLVCDEYTGILYPLLLRALRGIAGAMRIPYFSIAYALQLIAATWAMAVFLGSFELWKRLSLPGKIWAVLSLVTLPMGMQCHLAVLPISLASSLFVAQLGMAWRSMREGTNTVWVGVLALAAGLLLPDYRLFGGAVLVATSIFHVLSNGGRDRQAGSAWIRRVTGILLIAAVFLGVGGALAKWTTKPGAYGRMQNTLEAATFRRFAWDDFGEMYSEWPEELRETLTQEEIRLGNLYPLQKEWILGRKVDAVYGRERAREIYGQAALASAKIRFARNCREMAWDVLYYGFAPPMQLLLRTGWGQTTLSGRNLDIMRATTPRLTAWYVNYGHAWFLGALILATAMTMSRSLFHFKGGAGKRSKGKWLFPGAALLMIFAYVMQGGGIMDYKNSLPVTVLWATWTCLTALETWQCQ